MNVPRLVSIALVAGGIAIGTVRDRVPARTPLVLGGYRVLAADFHVHSSMWSDGLLTPWGIVLEAEHQGLDVIAVTAHNEVWDAQRARAFSERIGGPIVLVGEEIVSEPHYHMVAAGLQHTVSFRQSTASAIAAVHAQGGIAIAAHPDSRYWEAYTADARRMLDGAEVCHPHAYATRRGAAELAEFFQTTSAAAIGSSDYHGYGPLGLCRTYVFAADASADAVLDAVRARRTVVFGPRGAVYGDPALIPLAEAADLADRAPSITSRGTAADWLSRIAGLVGLLGTTMTCARRKPKREN